MRSLVLLLAVAAVVLADPFSYWPDSCDDIDTGICFSPILFLFYSSMF